MCCTEMEDCVESLRSKIVMENLAPGQVLTCITDHPGFADVCISKWALRVAGGKFMTRNHERYHQRESEEKYVVILIFLSYDVYYKKEIWEADL